MANSSGNIEYRTQALESFYRQHRTRWDQFYESERVVFEKLGLSAATSVLDLGCGCGGLGAALRERFGVIDYTGVEINRPAAQAAPAVCPTGRFVCADFLTLSPSEVADEAFDVVVSLSCIDWNIEFSQMLARAYRFVRPGGWFVASFRLTTEESLIDLRRSYQYINFEGKREGEIAPYVVLNGRDLLRQLESLRPARIAGFGYWGKPSATAVTPLERIGFAVLALAKPTAPGGTVAMELELPAELIGASSE